MTRDELYRDKNECGVEVYNATEADSVMDAMEQRINVLNAEYDLLKSASHQKIESLEKQLEDVQNTMATENTDLGMENHRLKERVKELEDELQVSNRCAEGARERIKELEASQPKWISVEDRLPIECENVVCLEDKWDAMSVCWLTYEEKRWTDGDRDYPMDYYTHWMPLPQPPKSED